ncbi:Gfo/Idh/MocA family protein [Kiritimatiella glycovorans]|uniref:1,5-anhydro-D-fructose reductase n=1 Tax=Kiritimatiella glycovorans TaxID=1307763 RepID=A0A0G3ED41_9BACT|nr:Gfo/Idh/MocA family oxidoreductase [Kiritimatiella glycovorans]AKJ64386.1 1,5-anhydro-D-fructose reductase [Kiritimatiella glycovorans]
MKKRRTGTNGLARRAFLRSAAALSSPLILPRGVRGMPAPSNRITVGFIGLGRHGFGVNLKSMLAQPDMEPVALCDVDTDYLKRAMDHVKSTREITLDRKAVTTDWREVIARSDIDAVMISTPDHWHVPIALAALRAGKDVICEKPTLTIEEGQVLRRTVREYGRVFQGSMEDRAMPMYHRMAELVRNGHIGKLRHIGITVPGAPWSETPPRGQPPQFEVKSVPVPATLDYDMWLGPAPEAPYQPERVHYMNPAGGWRFIRDYSGGMLSDWGVHMGDTAQWASNTESTGPIDVSGRGYFFRDGLYNTAHQFQVRYRYAEGFDMTIESGGTGIRFEGTDGWLEVSAWARPIQASDPTVLRHITGPNEVRLYTDYSREHRNFLDCVKSRRDPYFPVEALHRVSTIVHLGNIALQLERPLTWDPQQERFPDDARACSMMSREMRAPWTL